MKKLMIALTAVAMAAGVQAANIDWSLTGNNLFKNAKGDKIAATDNIQAYLCLNSSVASLVSALEAGTLTSSTAGVLDYASVADKGLVSKKTSPASASISTSVENDFTVLLVDSTSVAGKTYYEYATPSSKFGYDASDPDATAVEAGFTYKSFATSVGGSGWVEANVPEPTSGLLLLLGVAGLALRRRRA